MAKLPQVVETALKDVNPEVREHIIELLEEAKKKFGRKRKLTIKNLRSSNGVMMFEYILEDMLERYPQGQPILIAGDPGEGKTSFVYALSRALQMGLIVIEAPHVAPDHIAPIPYFYYNPKGKKVSSVAATKDEKEVRLSKSKLLTDIQNAVKECRSKKFDRKKAVQEVKAKFGPRWAEAVEQLAPLIEKVRERYCLILFVDELYRASTTNVRNILRDVVLDRKVHGAPLPKQVYVLMATNTEDIGVQETSEHYSFEHEYFAYSPEELKDYWVNSLGVNPAVAELVIDSCRGEDGELLTGRAPDGDAYASKRRLTHFALVLDQAIKTNDEDLKRLALTLARTNFQDPQSGDVHPLQQRLVEVTKKLFGDLKPFDEQTWDDALEAHFKLVTSLGTDKYKHVLSLSGRPGIAKTTKIEKFAKKHGLKFYRVSITSLGPDDTIGIPNVNPGTGDTSFDNPTLFSEIVEGLGITKEELEEAQRGCEEKVEPKYVVLLDEISRPASPRVLNFIRRMMLDKQINDDPRTKLPCGTIVITAMNPTDTGESVVELSMHVKDVMDYIPAGINVDQFKQYLFNRVKSDIAPWADETAKYLYQILADASPGVDDSDEPKEVPEEMRPFWQGIENVSVWTPPRFIDKAIGRTLSFFATNAERLKEQGVLNVTDPDEVVEVLREEFGPGAPHDLCARFAKTIAGYVDRKDKQAADEVFKKIYALTRERLDQILRTYMVRTAEVLPLEEIFEITASSRQKVTAAVKADFVNLQQWLIGAPNNRKLSEVKKMLQKIADKVPWPKYGEAVAAFVKQIKDAYDDLVQNKKALLETANYPPAEYFMDDVFRMADIAAVTNAYATGTAKTIKEAEKAELVANFYWPHVKKARQLSAVHQIRKTFFEAYRDGKEFEGRKVDDQRLKELLGLEDVEIVD